MKRIDVEDVLRILELRREIDSHKTDEVEYYYRGHKIPVSQDDTESFIFTGLGLTSFIEMVVVPEYTPAMKDLPIKTLSEEVKRKNYLDDMTPEKAVRIAKAAGILNEDGSLNDFYRNDND